MRVKETEVPVRSEETIAGIRRVNLITAAALKCQQSSIVYAPRYVCVIEITFSITKRFIKYCCSEVEEIYFNSY